jgi:hypothetical protein
VNDRIKDVVFDWNRMLALNGNTAPSMYAYSCICSILRKLVDGEEIDTALVRAVAPTGHRLRTVCRTTPRGNGSAPQDGLGAIPMTRWCAHWRKRWC